MKKNLLGIPLFWYLIAFAVAIIGILFGSFFDKSLSDSIASSTNGFGMFVETFSESLAYSVGTIGALLLWLGLWRRKHILAKIIGWVALVGGTGFLTYKLGDSLYNDKVSPLVQYGFLIDNVILCYVVAFLILGAIDVVVFLLVDRSESKFNRLVRIGAIMVLAMLLQWLCMHFLKRIGGRPRWRFLYELGGVWEGEYYDFQNWWQFAWFGHPNNDYFKSWPSGHTATASLVPLIALLPGVFKKDFKHSNLILFCSGMLYAFVVAFARILAGAHFLSDVSFGFLVGSLVSFLSLFLASKILPEKEEGSAESQPAEAPKES
ncbi:MAG: phosphatase PAP2 family protein [Bacilli bacterium]|nr:phosphatase PAP2 family protein [Bacilli bacterium]